MKSKVFVGVLFVIALLSGACSREANQNQPVTTTTERGSSTAPPAEEVKKRDNALVRVIHAVPGAAAVDVFVDDQKAFSGVAYKTVTPYKELSGERHTFRLRPAGLDSAQPLAENSEGLGDGKHYTVIALPSEDGRSVTLRVLEDELVPPSSGKARVRVINASNDAGEIDVYPQGKNEALFSGINFKSEGGYKEVDPMSGTLEVRPEGQNRPVLSISNVKFDAGKTYTIVIVGHTRTTPRLEAITVEDQFGGRVAMR